MSRRLQNESLTVRLPGAHRELLDSAAALELTTVSEYARRALVAAARETAREHRELAPEVVS
jgi:uncharacterized protein (DUF1778 family)